MITKAQNRFIKFNFIAIVVTLLVILAGAVVRGTGSGMGCPDWPKCFGQYVPPTKLAELPSDYKEKYVAKRLKKNELFAKILDKLGKHELANKVRHDESIAQAEEFNVANTWTEYINRLIGALTGICLFVLIPLSFAFKKTAKRLILLSSLNFLVVVFQAVLGAIVVSTNLMPWVLTAHMLLALVILLILIYTYNYAKQLYKEPSVIMYRINWLKGFLIFSIAVTILQIVLGTEVREGIDEIAKSMHYNGRNGWISKLGNVFSYHRDLAIVVCICGAVVYKMVIDRFSGKEAPLQTAKYILLILLLQVISGFVLSYVSLPPVAQVLHLMFSFLLFSCQYYLYLLVYRTKTYNPSLNRK